MGVNVHTLSEVDWGAQIDLGSQKLSQILSSCVYRISATEYSLPMEEAKRNQVRKQNLSGKIKWTNKQN